VRLGAVPETPLEWLALRLGWVPTPLVDTHLAFAFARTLMVSVRLGVFEAFAEGDRSVAEVARRCGTRGAPTEQLVHALVGMGYLRPGHRAGEIALTAGARRWLTRGSPHEVVDKVLFAFDEWRFVEAYEDYVRHGRTVDMHAGLAGAHRADEGAGWARYQRGLRAVAGVSADEVARRTPVPRGARRMLDLGGAHGRFAAAILRRHPALEAVIVELAPAVTASADLLAAEGLGDRLRHRVGDVLRDPLGEGDVDIVFASQFNHHFGDDDNRRLAARVAEALRPGGVYVIQDLARPRDAQEARRARLGALLDFYFGATSDAGTYPIAAMRAWQVDAGLRPRPPRWLRTLPGLVQQTAVKPG
jgi:SAM-dependent methyltransferase